MKFLLVMCLLLLFVSSGDCNAFHSLNSEAMYDCYIKLCCPLNKMEEFQRLATESGELSGKVFEWIKIVIGVEFPENTIENWNKYREVICNNSEEVNKKQFNEFFQLGGEYWLEVCFNMFSKGCKTAEEGAKIIADYFAKHFENGNCDATG